MLLLVILFAVDVPWLIIEMFGLPLPRMPWGTSYLAPFVVILLVSLVTRLQPVQRPLEGGVTLLFGAILVLWGMIEWFHGLAGANFNLQLVFQNVWFYLAFYLTRLHLGMYPDFTRSGHVVLTVLVLICVSHLFLSLLIISGLKPAGVEAAEVRGRNGISFLACFGLYLSWFVVSPQRVMKFPMVVVSALLFCEIVLNHARGALLLALALLGAHLLNNRIPARLIHGAFWTMSLVIVGIGVAGYTIAVTLDLVQPVAQGGYYLKHETGVDDSMRSIVYRLASNAYLLDELAARALLGLGSDGANSVRVGGYPSHTYYLLPLAAYGIIGFVPYLILFCFLYADATEPRSLRLTGGIFFMLCVMTFSNDLWAWLGMMWAFMVVPLKKGYTRYLHGGAIGQRGRGAFKEIKWEQT